MLRKCPSRPAQLFLARVASKFGLDLCCTSKGFQSNVARWICRRRVDSMRPHLRYQRCATACRHKLFSWDRRKRESNQFYVTSSQTEPWRQLHGEVLRQWHRRTCNCHSSSHHSHRCTYRTHHRMHPIHIPDLIDATPTLAQALNQAFISISADARRRANSENC